MKTVPVILASCVLPLLLAGEVKAQGPRMRTGDEARVAVTTAREHLRRPLGALVERSVLAAGASTVVRFDQQHAGLPVLDGAVAVRLGPGGEVQRVVGEASPMTVGTQPTLTARQARERAAQVVHVRVDEVNEPSLAVLPDPRSPDGGRLVWQMTAASAPGGERVLVDAQQGTLAGRRLLAHQALGRVYPTSASTGLTVADLPLSPLATASPLRLSSDDGQLSVYEYVDGDTASGLAVHQSVGPSSGQDFLYSPSSQAHDTTDAFASVNSYYHAQRVRSYFTDTFGLDMSKPSWQLGLVVNVLDRHGDPMNNSFFSEHGLDHFSNVIVLGQGDVDFAYDEDILAHEFTHYVSHNAIGFNPGLFATDAQGRISYSASIDEGVADYFACSQSNDARFGNTLPAEWQRNLAGRAMRCPEDVTGEAHNDGQIIARAAWAIREVLGSQRADSLVWNAVTTLTWKSSMQDFATSLREDSDAMVASGSMTQGERDAIEATLADRGLLDCDRVLSVSNQGRTSQMMGLDQAASYYGSTCELMAPTLQLNSSFLFSFRPEPGTTRVRWHAEVTPTTEGSLRWSLIVRKNEPVSFIGSVFGNTVPDAYDVMVQDITGTSTDLDIGDASHPMDPDATYYAVIMHSNCAETTLTMSATAIDPSTPAAIPAGTVVTPPEPRCSVTAPGVVGSTGWAFLAPLALAFGRRIRRQPQAR